MDNPLVAKLENVADLTKDQREVLRGLCDHARVMPPNYDILREGDKPNRLHLILEGWAIRYNNLADGSRQITAFLIPGDFCDLHTMVLQQMDHSIATLGPAKIAYIPLQKLHELIRQQPELAQALWWATLVDEGVLRAWIVNLGRRDAFKRTAHLMCEMYERMNNVGLVAGDQFLMPLTQVEIADSLGLTPVHVNRVIQKLRQDKLIVFEREQLTICDIERLKRLSDFDPAYLHPEHVRLD
ncbi:Crp/Fnr family transcriptional regulator [Sphingomonas qomolangmaensis]|uniref:Crp/Fnr family transcriptional regulator n=1 Tax=Sphingomonas qomolangmaensis TaxID=2918765 RepID=A0ABY5LA74_9SPHN|nr:Crp/Fnr family transcriptional regulator [Sphingomonas qomolangmaensis]UUL83667.1 Crp/Fnr family transcriptional regulator [Sphingomonas qomolangmaensis]